MKVIGHRGAAGLALENTLSSFKKAEKTSVTAIEMDIRRAKNGRLVAIHDRTTRRVAGQNLVVSKTDSQELTKLVLNDGKSHISELSDIITSTSKPLIFDIKQTGCIDQLLKDIGGHSKERFTVVSTKLSELLDVHAKDPNIKTMAVASTRPIRSIRDAHQYGLSGIALGFWLINPLTYMLIKLYNLECYVWTVNNKWIAKLITTLYPSVIICTDRPDKIST